eukprot:Blabericola_migrator_1__9734@NODE_532_length_7786_cov_102_495531_g405_i0_p3_GENE_NODE_532_length_7786_cov_102_495531_g405_i0NODE_532_length_7786_cov_102_495531_g405_i0_p3_ORF_typecomplete_len284_score26_40MIR/PF02815_19/0_11MIR/PF02815_19/1_9e14Ins145_P3_rec/PF08709_11/0_081Ins145_P3_rec/PF08709_11/0_00014_NODE_532_length_7786_cov_102_495531_g405_i029893840
MLHPPLRERFIRSNFTCLESEKTFHFMWRLWGLFFLVVRCARTPRPITYGSVIQLEHVATSNRLYSLAKVTWSNGGQIVSSTPTFSQSPDFEATGWIVRNAGHYSAILSEEKLPYFSTHSNVNKSGQSAFQNRKTGSEVFCGAIIRLEHEQSGKFLHSHTDPSSLTNNYEVVGFGQRGEGDSNDHWRVKCENADDKVWLTQTEISLVHVLLENPLISTRRAEFNERNCPRCPIQRHLEVAVASKPPRGKDLVTWRAHSMMRVSLTDAYDDEDDDVDDSSRDEL